MIRVLAIAVLLLIAPFLSGASSMPPACTRNCTVMAPPKGPDPRRQMQCYFNSKMVTFWQASLAATPKAKLVNIFTARKLLRPDKINMMDPVRIEPAKAKPATAKKKKARCRKGEKQWYWNNKKKRKMYRTRRTC